MGAPAGCLKHNGPTPVLTQDGGLGHRLRPAEPPRVGTILSSLDWATPELPREGRSPVRAFWLQQKGGSSFEQWGSPDWVAPGLGETAPGGGRVPGGSCVMGVPAPPHHRLTEEGALWSTPMPPPWLACVRVPRTDSPYRQIASSCSLGFRYLPWCPEAGETPRPPLQALETPRTPPSSSHKVRDRLGVLTLTALCCCWGASPQAAGGWGSQHGGGGWGERRGAACPGTPPRAYAVLYDSSQTSLPGSADGAQGQVWPGGRGAAGGLGPPGEGWASAPCGPPHQALLTPLAPEP